MDESVLFADRFHNEEAAFEYVEAMLWPEGPVCPRCQNDDQNKIGRLQGKTTRRGLRNCYVCRKPFTVRMGTILEDSKFPLRLWLQAVHLLCTSKKGISGRQLRLTLGCGAKTAWHLRKRFAMDPKADVELPGWWSSISARINDEEPIDPASSASPKSGSRMRASSRC
jgi:transposase-like protein